jgi:hypothetical protein
MAAEAMRPCGFAHLGGYMRESGVVAALLFSLLLAPNPIARAQEFEVDPDITLDSVVQVGDGLQELSTDVRFYPNTQSAEPGDTVYWTLDLGDLKGPFTVMPEMNNDDSREAAIQADESPIVIPYSYSTPNLYIPSVSVHTGTGSILVVYTTTPVAVRPNFTPHVTSTVEPQTLETPTGTNIKGVNAFVIDNDSTYEELESEIARIKSDGFNMLYIPFFVTTSGCVTLPAYHGLYDNAFYRTPDLEILGEIAQLCASEGLILGMSPGISPNPFNWEHQNDDLTDDFIDMFFYSYRKLLVAYASLFSDWGVSLFQVGREFPVLAGEEAHWRDVISAVRDVFPYAVTYAADPTYELYRVRFWDALDYFSVQGYFLPRPGEGIASVPWSEEQIRRWLRFTFQYNIEPLERQLGIPFLNVEVGFPSPARGLAEDYQAMMFTALLEESDVNAYQAGNILWEWGIGPGSDRYLAHGFEGFRAEEVIQEHLLETLDLVTLDLHPEERVYDAILIDSFETPGQVTTFSEGSCSIRASLDTGDSFIGFSSLRVDYRLTDSGWAIIDLAISDIDLTNLEAITFALKSDGEGGHLTVVAFDDDGAQSSILLGRVLYVPGWQQVRVKICDLNPDGLWQSLAKPTVHHLEKIRFVLSPDTDPLSLFRNHDSPRVLYLDDLRLEARAGS